MANNQSTFTEEFGYLIDSFEELQDLRWSDLTTLDEYRELKMKKNDGQPIDQNRLDQLETIFQNKIVTSARWNKFQNALVGMQTYITTEIHDVISDGQSAISSAKDNALISIENKKDNVIEYLDGTTAGQFRNDIGDMTQSNIDGRSLVDKTNYLNESINNISMTLPIGVNNFDSVSQWVDILIPDEVRGKALLGFLLTYEESSLQTTESEQAMMVIIEQERFDKDRQVPFDYDQIIFKLGEKTEVGQYLAWVEELLADHTRGTEKLELGMMLESGSLEISTNKYAMNAIMQGEQVVGLSDYRRKLADKTFVDAEVQRLDNRIDGVVV